MHITTPPRFALFITACASAALFVAPAATAESVQGSDRLVRNNRIVGNVKSVLIQDNGTSVAVDARVRDFVAPTAPMTYRARLVVNLTCADRGSDPTDADYSSRVDKFSYIGPWKSNGITATTKLLLAQPLFTSCPRGQVIARYLVRFQVIDSRGNSVGLAFVAPSTPLL